MNDLDILNQNEHTFLVWSHDENKVDQIHITGKGLEIDLFALGNFFKESSAQY